MLGIFTLLQKKQWKVEIEYMTVMNVTILNVEIHVNM